LKTNEGKKKLLNKRKTFYFLVFAVSFVASIVFAAGFGITSAGWNGSKWTVSGTGEPSATTVLVNRYNWSFYQNIVGNSTTGNWSASFNTTDTSVVPCSVSITQGNQISEIKVPGAPNNCLGKIEDPPYGLVAAYTFSESSGTVIHDFSGNGNDGTLVGGAVFESSGKYGGALRVDGVSGKVFIKNSPTLEITNGMTIEAWVYPEKAGGPQSVVLKENQNDLSYGLYSGNSSGYPGVWIAPGRSVSYGKALTLNAWSHLAATWNGQGLRLYVNGTLVKNVTNSGSFSGVSSGGLSIGGNAIFGEYFQGKIDEVRIYNRALTPKELTLDRQRSSDVRLVDFDNPTPPQNEGGTLSVFERIDFFGSDLSWVRGPYSGYVNNHVRSTSGSGSFSLKDWGVMTSIRATAPSNGVLTISDDQGQNVSKNLLKDTPATISFGWVKVSKTLTYSFSGPVAFDEIKWKVSVDSLVPSTTLSANPSTILSGSSAVLTWGSRNAVFCSAPWTNSSSASGSQSVSPTKTTSYSITCTGSSGELVSASTAVTVILPPAPSVALAVAPSSIMAGESATLTWSSVGANTCSSPWTESMATSGSKVVSPLQTTNYAPVVCIGAGGTGASGSATVQVTYPPAPSVVLTANPVSVSPGGSSLLSWTSLNALSCSASWAGSVSLSGTASVVPSATTEYTVVCVDNWSRSGSSSVEVAVLPVSSPVTIWSETSVPINPVEQDSGSVELGVKFKTDTGGKITGIRFYKGSSLNGGAHVGNLWDLSGNRLATVVFSGETSSGWQQANFSSPVVVSPGTVYVASYYAPMGYYAGDNAYFSTSGYGTTSVFALRDGESGGNGVYKYGSASSFPNETWSASNYWVDVVFLPDGPQPIQSVRLAWDPPETWPADVTSRQYCIFMSNVPDGPYAPETRQCVSSDQTEILYTFEGSGTRYFVAKSEGVYSSSGAPAVSGPSNEVSKFFDTIIALFSSVLSALT